MRFLVPCAICNVCIYNVTVAHTLAMDFVFFGPFKCIEHRKQIFALAPLVPPPRRSLLTHSDPPARALDTRATTGGGVLFSHERTSERTSFRTVETVLVDGLSFSGRGTEKSSAVGASIVTV